MITVLIHSAACVALVVAATHYRIGAGAEEVPGAHRFLFPFAVIVGLAAIGTLLPWAMEWFVAYYSGSKSASAAFVYRITGPYWWAYCLQVLLSFLPVAGILPPIGARPLLVAGLGLLALLPVAVWIVFSLTHPA